MSIADEPKSTQRYRAADSDVTPPLKQLRKKRKVSRAHVSKITRLSTYQIEGIERTGTHNLLGRVFKYIKALGCDANDLVHMIEQQGCEGVASYTRGALSSPTTETIFTEGAKISALSVRDRHFLGYLQIMPGKSLYKDHFPAGDVVLGFVREGTIVMETLLKQSVYKRDHFFILSGNRSVELSNGDSHQVAAALLFAITHPE